jgi:hypothetical protein
MYFGLWSLWIGAIAMGCSTVATSSAAPFRTVAKGAFSGIQEPKQQVIRNEIDWEKLWTSHAAMANKPSEKRPLVDFSKEMIVFVTMGRQRSGGFSLEITDVTESDGKLRIIVRQKRPAQGSMTIQSLTAPFHIVAVPKTDAKPEFVNARSTDENSGSPAKK